MSDWVRTVDASTPYVALAAVVEHYVEVAMDDLRAQLLTIELSDAERAAMVAKARPLVVEKTRETIEAGWWRLQADAQRRPM